MTVSQGSTIRAVDYNDIQTKVSNILGTGSATSGYGQVVSSNQIVAVGQDYPLIEDTDYATLKSDILKIAGHQGRLSDSQVSSMPTILPNMLIDNENLNAFESAIDHLTLNRFDLGIGQYTDQILNTQTRTTPWGLGGPSQATSKVRHNFTITFSNSNAARHYFNSGGSIIFKASRTGGTATQQNTNWTNLLSAMGVIYFNYTTVFSETYPATTFSPGTSFNIGWFDLTESPITIFTKTGSSSYTGNDYTITASRNSAGSELYFSVLFQDDHTANLSANDTVNGTLISEISSRRATGSNVSVQIPSITTTVSLTA